MPEDSLDRRFQDDPLVESVEDVRDRECDSRRPPDRHGEPRPLTGEGNGVISAMAASCGEEITDDKADDGDSESVFDVELRRPPRRLGVRCGRLAADKLWCRGGASDSWGVTGRPVGRSVRIWSPANGVFLA